MAQKPWIVPIPGTRKLHRLEENIGAADVQLSADELTEIEDAASKIQVHGGRYNEAAEQMTNLAQYRTPVLRFGRRLAPRRQADRVGSTREGGQWHVLS